MRALLDDDGPDARIAALAAAQHGVVTRAQLLRAGLSPRQIGLRLERRRLLALSRGVYAPGHVHLTRSGRLLAATWSPGPEGVLFEASAAGLHDVRRSGVSAIHVVRPGRSPWRAPAGVRAYVSTTLRPQDCTTIDGIRVTTLARTVVDLAARRPPRVVERVLDEMVTLGVYDQRALDEQLERPFTRGTRQLAEILATHQAGSTGTKSELEELFLTVCAAHGLPRPRMNAWLSGVEVDAHFAGTAVLVELDSAQFHSSRRAFERDRAKGNALVSAGWVVLRVTWRQLTDDPGRVAQLLRTALATAPAPAPAPAVIP